MNEYLKMVSEFHKTFQSPILEIPLIPSTDRCDLRVKLIQEELDEMKEGIKNDDIVEIADSLADQLYVILGAILEFGLGDKFDDIFHEVQRSNMSKTCNSEKEAIDTLSAYQQKDETVGYYKEVNGKWLVYRTSDDKVLKSINYSPADIKSIIGN